VRTIPAHAQPASYAPIVKRNPANAQPASFALIAEKLFALAAAAGKQGV